MSQPFMGEIRTFGFPFAPRGWAQCNGQLIAIVQNQALFSLLGTNYGGDGIQTFGLPNLRGRTPIGFGNGPGLSPYVLGQIGGEESHTLIPQEIPQHNHTITVSNAAATSPLPTNNMLAQPPSANLYVTPDNTASLSLASLASVGGSAPHENRQPLLVANICIALLGIFPSRN